MDIALVCTRLVNAAATVTPKLTPLGYMPDSPTPPCIYVSDLSIDFDGTFNRGQDKATVTLQLLCSRADDRASQLRLFAYLAGAGPSSIKEALENARGAPGESALAGACDDFHVTRVSGLRFYTAGASSFVGVEFTVDVYGPGG